MRTSYARISPCSEPSIHIEGVPRP
jgi:hypothetical protein